MTIFFFLLKIKSLMQLTRERRKRRPGSGYKEAGPTPEAHEAAMWLEQGRGRKWLWTGATLCSS